MNEEIVFLVSFNDEIRKFSLPKIDIKLNPVLNLMLFESEKYERIDTITYKGEKYPILKDFDPRHVKSYVDFLTGYDFIFDADTEKFFDYLGYDNEHYYPRHIFKCKLIDEWIRQNYIRHNFGQLYNVEDVSEYIDPAYNKHRHIKFNKIMRIFCDEEFIIGNNIRESFLKNELYIYIINSKKRLMEFILKYEITKFHDSERYLSFSFLDLIIHVRKRIYESLTELIYSFRVDSNSMIHHMSRYLGIELCKLSLKENINYFDINHLSEEYIDDICSSEVPIYITPMIIDEIKNERFRKMLKDKKNSKIFDKFQDQTTLTINDEYTYERFIDDQDWYK